uniref:RdRp n=1 Tax=viral metagenome TaxID=1070528 RepID=A0A2V0RBL0_9ZZZZ
MLGKTGGIRGSGLQSVRDASSRHPRERELVEKTLVSILVTLTLSGSLDDVVCQKARRARAVSVLHWTLSVWSTRGYHSLLTELKGLSHYCRTVALNSDRHPLRGNHRLKPWFGLGSYSRGPGERMRFSQISRLARSLPICPASWLPSVEADYLETVCPPEEPVTDQEVLGKLCLLGRAWAAKNHPSVPPPMGKTSTSAGFSHRVKDGGSNFAWAEVATPQVEVTDEIGERVLDQLCGTRTIDPDGAQSARKGETVLQGLLCDAAKLASAVHRVSVSEEPYRVRPAIIQEKGGKTRPVTCHEVDELVTAHFLRDLFWGPLQRWGPVKDSIAGDKLSAVRRVVKGPRRGRRVYSSDLSAATDNLHQDAATVVADSVLERWGFAPGLRSTLSRILGHHRIGDSLQTRGILMGSPLSWTILNLTNFFCYCMALRPNLRTEADAAAVIAIAEAEVSLCGDDLIGFSKLETITRYEETLGDIGYIANIDKSFVSSTGGIFTELSFSVLGGFRKEKDPFPPLNGEQRDWDVRVVHAVAPIGDIPAKVFDPVVLSSIDAVPDIGPPCTAALSYVPKALRPIVLRRMKRCAGVVAPSLTVRLLSAGIDPGAPRGLGGAELPWCAIKLGSTARLASVLASGNVLRSCVSSGDTSVLLKANLATGWSPTPYYPGMDLALSLAQADFPPETLGLSEVLPGYDSVPVFRPNTGSFDAQVRAAAAAHLQALRSFGVVPSGGPRSVAEVGLRKLSAQIRASRATLMKVYPTAPPSGRPIESLRRWSDISDKIVAGPYDPTQIVQKLRGPRKRRRYDFIVAHPDAGHNRHNLWTACTVAIPGFSLLVPEVPGVGHNAATS